MNHYVVTRFNVRAKWKEDKNARKVRTHDWIKHRMTLFESYCYPSLQAQTVKDFTWVLYFDPGTDVTVIRRIEELKSQGIRIIVRYIDHLSELKNDLIRYIRSDSKGEDYVITTRIDNDDAFAVDALELIREKSRSFSKAYIDLRKGVRYELSTGRLFELNLIHGPFSSLKEPLSDLETIMSRAHSDWGRQKDTEQVEVEDVPCWLQVIHERNQRNEIRMAFRCVSYKKIIQRFRFLDNLEKKDQVMYRIIHNTIRRPMALLYSRFRQLLNKIRS